MAIVNYLISGLPGTGKTSVCKELLLRGFYAVDADEVLAHKVQDDWIWQDRKLRRMLDDSTKEELFICGSASNRDKYIHLFAKVFILHIDNETLKTRLTSRANNNFGKDPMVLARQLQLNEGVKDYSIKRGRILIDAAQPITKVVDEIVSKTKQLG